MNVVMTEGFGLGFSQSAFAFSDEDTNLSIKDSRRSRRTGSFTDNMSLPVHRWFRYSAGFSAEWVEMLIDRHHLGEADIVLDPFAGCGTTMLAAQAKNVTSFGAESHPFVRRIANTKLLWDSAAERDLIDLAAVILDQARTKQKTQKAPISELLRKCYTPDVLGRLAALRDVYLEDHADHGDSSQLVWLAITSILRECSGVGTAQWQYVLPNKTKTRVQDPFVAFQARIMLFCADMQELKRRGAGVRANVECSDARDLSEFAFLDGRVRLVVTSPPYPNNYDYADATRLEMTFWGEIEGWGDLQQSVRRHLVRSCSQHSAAERLSLSELLADNAIAPIAGELTKVCNEMAEIRETKGGKKTYHTMVAAYFVDLAKVWKALHGLCTEGADVHFVVGDSAPYGVYVPADRWLGELALAAGFRTWSFDKVRDRNIKWKNRKHRVPLKEGNLWVRN
jgi:hypothetical protein